MKTKVSISVGWLALLAIASPPHALTYPDYTFSVTGGTDFGNVVEGTTSSPLVFDVQVTPGTNPGLVILLPISTGATIWNDSGNTCPATVSPSLSCFFEATFSPDALGPRSFAFLYFFNYYDPTERLPFGIDSGVIILTVRGSPLLRRFPPPSRSSPPVSARWACLAGAGSGRTRLLSQPDQNT
jgi:hypothetical protein